MMSLLRRLMHLDDKDPIEQSVQKTLDEHEAAMKENRAVHVMSQHSTQMLESAVLLSKLRSMRFAEFETSIKGKNNHA